MRTAPLVWIALGVLSLAALPAGADERKYTYSYEAKTLPKGVFESEHWATFRTGKEDGTFLRIDFREELEYGLTDRLTTALYLNFEYLRADGVSGLDNERDLKFDGVSSEWKYRLTDAGIFPVGLLAYAEVSVREDEVELETKMVVSRELGPVSFAYNLVLELAWEKEEDPSGETDWKKGSQIAHTAGLSCDVGSGVNVGLEAVARQDLEGSFSATENHSYFVGPNLHVSSPGWWATLTLLKQVDIKENTGLVLDGQERYEIRLIFGIHF
ncbi:MAG TPA: DUF6662 family protein [Planctomycetota bacterium]|jgi:uncharacterized protein DUF6662|nr:DUF6662 family protein [Planctomycetota bacterium]